MNQRQMHHNRHLRPDCCRFRRPVTLVPIGIFCSVDTIETVWFSAAVPGAQRGDLLHLCKLPDSLP